MDGVDAAHRSLEDLHAGLHHVRAAPPDEGVVELIVRRPADDEREVLAEGELSAEVGLVGDNWRARGNRHTSDGAAHPGKQLNIMNARAATLVAGDRARWALAGDQLYIDLDLSATNLPAGTRLAMGSAVVEVTAEPHRGCAKFRRRFGEAALRLVNSPVGVELNLRGICARVVEAGLVRTGDTVTKLPLA